MTHLWVDPSNPCPLGWRWATNVKQAQDILTEHWEDIGVVSLTCKTDYEELLEWIDEYGYNHDTYNEIRFTCHDWDVDCRSIIETKIKEKDWCYVQG